MPTVMVKCTHKIVFAILVEINYLDFMNFIISPKEWSD